MFIFNENPNPYELPKFTKKKKVAVFIYILTPIFFFKNYVGHVSPKNRESNDLEELAKDRGKTNEQHTITPSKSLTDRDELHRAYNHVNDIKGITLNIS